MVANNTKFKGDMAHENEMTRVRKRKGHHCHVFLDDK